MGDEGGGEVNRQMKSIVFRKRERGRMGREVGEREEEREKGWNE